MPTINTTSQINPAITKSGFPAVTITLPEVQKDLKKDFFTLPVIEPIKKQEKGDGEGLIK